MIGTMLESPVLMAGWLERKIVPSQATVRNVHYAPSD